MTSDEIKNIIKNVVEHPETCGFQMCLVTKSERRLFHVILSQTQNNNLHSSLKQLITTVLQNKFLAEGVEYAPAEYVADNQKKFYMIEQNDLYRPFAFITSDPEDFNTQCVSDVMGLVFSIRQGDHVIYCYQNSRPITIPNRKHTGLLTRIHETQGSIYFEEQKEPMLSILAAIDAVIVNNTVVTNDIGMMERNFEFVSFINAKASEAISSIIATNIVANNEKLTDYIQRGRKTYARKMMRIHGSPVMNMSANALVEKIKSLPRWRGKFELTDTGKVKLNTYQQVENLIDLFDERFTRSDITGTEYDTGVKKRAEPVEQN